MSFLDRRAQRSDDTADAQRAYSSRPVLPDSIPVMRRRRGYRPWIALPKLNLLTPAGKELVVRFWRRPSA
jgi:hypothetical protein